MKHTPAPWKISIHEKNVSVFSEGWGPIAQTIGDSVPKKEKIANAHLIASAPELLEVCEKTVARLGQLIEPNMLENTIMEDLEQAIAKATQ